MEVSRGMEIQKSSQELLAPRQWPEVSEIVAHFCTFLQGNGNPEIKPGIVGVFFSFNQGVLAISIVWKSMCSHLGSDQRYQKLLHIFARSQVKKHMDMQE